MRTLTLIFGPLVSVLFVYFFCCLALPYFLLSPPPFSLYSFTMNVCVFFHYHHALEAGERVKICGSCAPYCSPLFTLTGENVYKTSYLPELTLYGPSSPYLCARCLNFVFVCFIFPSLFLSSVNSLFLCCCLFICRLSSFVVQPQLC